MQILANNFWIYCNTVSFGPAQPELCYRLLQEAYIRGVSGWNFDVAALKRSADQEGSLERLSTIHETPSESRHHTLSLVLPACMSRANDRVGCIGKHCLSKMALLKCKNRANLTYLFRVV